MGYVWSYHAAQERLPERSSFTQEQIEDLLDGQWYVVERNHFGTPQDHHLIWDPGRECLIGVPVIHGTLGSTIPTILPVSEKDGFPVWVRAEAERYWLLNEYYLFPEGPIHPESEVAEVWLAKTWTEWSNKANYYLSGSNFQRYEDKQHLFDWPLIGSKERSRDEDGLLALFRNYEFCCTVRDRILEMEYRLPELCDHVEPIIHLKKVGANPFVPTQFFLETP